MYNGNKTKLFGFILAASLGLTACGGEDNKKNNKANAPLVVSVNDLSIVEGNSGSSEAAIVIQLSKKVDQDVQVEYVIENGSAINGQDFIAESGTITIPAMANRGQIRFSVLGDTEFEDDENFTVRLTGTSNGEINKDKSKSVVTITNDDKAPEIGLKIGYQPVSETIGDVIIPIALSSKSAFEVSTVADFSGTASIGNDYTFTGDQKVVFLPGETHKEIVLTIVPDSIPEGGETIIVTLEQIKGATIAAEKGNKNPEAKSTVLILGDASLNDTGLTRFSNESTMINSEPSSHPNQDARFGRDANPLTSMAYDGVAGFSFTKLDISGNPLVSTAIEWRCIQDNVTGLVWENKGEYFDSSDKTNLVDETTWQANNYRYAWFKDNKLDNGGDVGASRETSRRLDKNRPQNSLCGYFSDPDRKGNLYCDTEAYATEMNRLGICGFNDWRLPEISELAGVANYNRTNGAIQADSNFFPNLLPETYLSNTPAANNGSSAWCFDYGEGEAKLCNKNYGNNSEQHVMLVRNKK